MRKPAFCICEKRRKSGNRAADQRLCFRYIDSVTIHLLPNMKFQAVHGFTAQFVSDLVGNTKDRFSHEIAHFS